MRHPEDLLARANHEKDTFGRVLEDTVCLLISEVARLHDIVNAHGYAHSHRCNKCSYAYTPMEDETEDCPKCGHNGEMQ